MEGNPLLRIALVLLALSAVLLPVWRITLDAFAPAAQTQTASENTPARETTRHATLLLRAVPPPLRCSVSQHGIDLLRVKNMELLTSTGEYRGSADLTPGEDLVITAAWGDDAPHALAIEVQAEGAAAPLEKTFWPRRTLEDVLPLPEAFTP